MTDPVYDAISDAIERPIDGHLFERCAVELLRDSYYPTLRPVQGGSDAGMDGIGELADGERFFLVATVGADAQGNLERNVRSHLDAGGDRRVVIFATSRPISGRRRAALAHQLWEQFEVRLHDVHDQGDFIQLLHRNPPWRRELLGVSAQARALTRLPANRRPTPSIPLIGRDNDLSRLHSASGDLVLIGKPGIGKTFLLQELMKENWGLFDDGWPIPELEDAIRELRPQRVVLDDAHLRDDRLAVLRRMRLEMGAEFDIVAVLWPGQVDEITEALPDASTYELLELDREQILQVIQEIGVAGPRDLQAHLVNQAMGRAGLAATLAYACVRGRARDVATGEALLTDVLGWFARSIGRESRHVLAVLALAGTSGATMRQVTQILGLDLSRLSDLIRSLASGGTVDEAPRREGAPRLRVQPESLRYALVKEVFFGGAGSLDAREVVGYFDRPSSALLPLIGAAHRGASVDKTFLTALVDPADPEQVIAYTLLGPEETVEALAAAPPHRTAIARAAYQAGVNSELMLRILLESAVGDGREEHNSPDHPLRIIGDHLAASERTIEERKTVVSVADGWLRTGGDSGVALRALAHAIHPGIRHVYTDPGLGNTVTIAEAALPVSLVRELSSVWDSVLEVVERERGASPAAIIEVLHYWVYPSLLGFGRSVDDELQAVFRDEASRVIRRLAEILRGRPGALRRLQDYASSAHLDVQIEIPDDFNVLFPEDWNGSEDDGGHDGWARRSDDAVRALATEMRGRPADDIASRIVSADSEATAVGITYPRFTPRLAQLLATEPSGADVLLAELDVLNAAGDVLLPFLERVVQQREGGWETTAQRMLDDERTTWITVQVLLTQAVGPNLKDMAIRRMTAAYHNLISFLIARGEIDGETIELLLDAPNETVARDTAISIWQASRGIRLDDLPPRARTRWREVIVRSPADDYWYSVILKSDPGLFSDWLREWFFKDRGPSNHEFLPHTLEESIRSLSAEVRADLVRAVPADLHSFLVQDVVTELIGDDADVALVLLGRDDLEDLHWTALRVGPNEAWMERALVALLRGWEPMRIVAQTTFAEKGWVGEESAQWQSKIDAFAALRDERADDADRERIIAAGIQFFTERRDAAGERERRERVFGFDRQ